MVAQILRYPLGVLHMAFDAERQRLDPLKQQEAGQGRQSRPGVSLANGPTTRDIGARAIVFGVDHAMIGGFRPVQHIKALGMPPPRKSSAINNHSTERRAVPSHEFRHGMHYDVGPVFDLSE